MTTQNATIHAEPMFDQRQADRHNANKSKRKANYDRKMSQKGRRNDYR